MNQKEEKLDGRGGEVGGGGIAVSTGINMKGCARGWGESMLVNTDTATLSSLRILLLLHLVTGMVSGGGGG